MKIYVIIASEGAWEDHYDWPVIAFTTENEAKLYIEKNNKEFVEAYNKSKKQNRLRTFNYKEITLSQ